MTGLQTPNFKATREEMREGCNLTCKEFLFQLKSIESLGWCKPCQNVFRPWTIFYSTYLSMIFVNVRGFMFYMSR